MKCNLFAYGTLLVPEIWGLVVGETFRNEPAILHGYEIRRARGGDFPGIFLSEDETAIVNGRIFHDLNSESIERLDAYEDSFYERIQIRAISEKGASVECDCYVVPLERVPASLSDDPWSLEWFEENARASYLKRLRGL